MADEKLNPKVKSTDRSQPYISDADGKVHIAETEVREDNIEKGSDIYREPKKVEGTVYVQDTSKGNVQLNDEVVVNIDGGTTDETTYTVVNQEVYATSANGSNAIVAGTDNTRFVQDRGKAQIIYDPKTGGNYAKNEKNWKETYSTRYEKKYKGKQGKAVIAGAATGVAYAVGTRVGVALGEAFFNLFASKKVYEVEFRYKCHQYDIVESIFLPREVSMVSGLTSFNAIDDKLNAKAKKKRSSITIVKNLMRKDVETLPKIDLSAAVGKEKGSLFQFFDTLRGLDEYSLDINISIYNYKPFWFNEYLGEYEMKKVRVDSYKLSNVGLDKEPKEELTVSGYLYKKRDKGGLLSEAKSSTGGVGSSLKPSTPDIKSGFTIGGGDDGATEKDGLKF